MINITFFYLFLQQYISITIEQVVQFKKITHMKGMGIPLRVIRTLIDSRTSPEEATALLLAHRGFLQNQIDLYNKRLAKLEWLQKKMEVENLSESKGYDIFLKDLFEISVRSVRKTLTSFLQELPALILSVQDEITSKGGMCAGPPAVLYYNEEFNPDEVDLEVAWPVSDKSLANNILPAGEAAAVMHVGPYNTLEKAYEALFEWVNKNGYKVVYPIREVYYNDPKNTPEDQLATEIILPVVRA
ncbi:MAG: Transcriptional regulator, MerR family [Desulfotomaculum sp. 46_80]|nr:MAG: Transcriptional regulator, MerR family [Desulfotomaculum sp. 46_80]